MRNEPTVSTALPDDERERIGYALAKQIPAMERGFTIQTSYGDLRIDAEDAAIFVAVASDLLQSKLGGTDKAAATDPAFSLRSALSTATSIEHLVASHTADLCAALELLEDALPENSNTQRMARICKNLTLDFEGCHESIFRTLVADIKAARGEVSNG